MFWQMVPSMYSETVEVTGVTTASNFFVVPLTLHLELLNRPRIIRRVLGTYNANDTMLRRSAQLLLAAENYHFEGSMHLKANEGEWR